jgi:hypothetical protein
MSAAGEQISMSAHVVWPTLMLSMEAVVYMKVCAKDIILKCHVKGVLQTYRRYVKGVLRFHTRL